MILTINTDASYHPKTKAASYAMWLVSDQGRLTYSKRFNQVMIDCHHAEMAAIVNALHMATNSGKYDFNQFHKIVINTDSAMVMRIFASMVPAGSKRSKPLKNFPVQYIECRNKFFDLMRYHGFRMNSNTKTFEFRKVKAHVEITDKRTYVNDWLDKAAKQARVA